MGKNITCVGDSSSHGGIVISAGQNTVYANGKLVAIDSESMHSCPIPGHGITPIHAITTKSYISEKLIVTNGAIAGCGAVIISPDIKTYVE